MAGGARHALKAKLTTAQAARAAAGGNGAWVWTERRNSPQVKPPRSPTDVLETEGRKRQQCKAESDFEASHALRKQKKRRLSISHEDSNAVASTPRTSKREDQDKEIAQNITSPSSEKHVGPPSHSLRLQTPSTAAQTNRLSTEQGGATTSQYDTLLLITPSSPTQSDFPHSSGGASLVEDLNSPHPDLWISFGRLQSLDNPRVSFALQMKNDGSLERRILIGHDRHGCDFLVFGPAQGIGRHHCTLILELSQPDGGPLCRGVVASNIQTAIGQPSLRTTITIGGVSYLLEDKLVLPPGATIQFGNGETYLYYGPELLTLYSEEKNVYGGKNLNSSVTRVKRLSDKVPFVAKKIDYSHIQMARTEIAVCRAVNHHPRIVQFIEAFYERDSGTHHLIFEAGYMDLYQYARQLRPRGQKIINANAPQWIEQITCGIEYLHRHNMAHRDIKPQNIIVFASKTGMTMKLGDMGIARPHTEPIVENWFAGTKRWTAPGSFMAFGDDRLVDCYGVGRLLFFLLTTYPWPEESRASNRGCNCLDACDGLCARRQAGFEAVKAAGAGKESRDLLKRLLVGFPSQCMNALEILDHPYLANAKSNSEEY